MWCPWFKRSKEIWEHGNINNQEAKVHFKSQLYFYYRSIFTLAGTLLRSSWLRLDGWTRHWAAWPPTPSSAGTRPSPAGTGAPCNWDARRRSRRPQTPCRNGRHGCASARGRRACYRPPPWTGHQSVASPRLSCAMSFPPGGAKAKDVARWKFSCMVPQVSPFATLSSCLPLHLHTIRQTLYHHTTSTFTHTRHCN